MATDSKIVIDAIDHHVCNNAFNSLSKNNLDDISDTESDREPKTEPEIKSGIPDGGWGWVVLAATLFIRVVMTGIYVSFALFIKEFTAEFKTSASTMSWMISIYSCVYLMVSPLASFLAMKFGHRRVSILGLILAGSIYPMTYFYPTMWFNFLTASILVPFFQGMANMCGTVILTTYFDKKVSIAMGVYSCGSGIASFMIPPIMTLVINRFGWRLSKVLYSLLYILAALAALTFRPVQILPAVPDIKKEDDDIEMDNENLKMENLDKVDNFFGSKDSNIYNFLSMANITSNLSLQGSKRNHTNSLRSLGVDEEERVKSVIKANVVNVPISALLGMSVASSLQLSTKANYEPVNDLENGIVKPEDSNETAPKKSGFLGLFKNPIFMLFLFSNLLSNLGYDTPYIYTKSKALELGVSESKATFLLTCLGIGNIIGRLFFGFLGSKKQVNTYLLNTCCLLIAGCCVIIGRITFSYPLMVFNTIGFGTFIGGYVTLGPVLLIQILDISDFSNGLSLLYVIQAIGLFAGAPISGMIYDATESFNWPFLNCGLIILTSGFLLILAFCSKNFREKQKKR